MADGLRFVVVDDNFASATTAKVLLESRGNEATIITERQAGDVAIVSAWTYFRLIVCMPTHGISPASIEIA